MNKYPLKIVLLLLMIFPAGAYCQKNEKGDSMKIGKKSALPLKIKIKYADALFQAGNYYDAIGEYSEILDMKPDNNQAVYQIGECYFMARDYINAEKWYADVIERGAEGAFPLVYYRLAMMQKMNGKYEEAKYTFAKFALRAQGDYITRAKREIEACDFSIKAMENPALFKMSHLDSTINSPGTEYAPVAAENRLYYSSFSRDTTAGSFQKPLSRIYVAERQSSAWKKGSLMSAPFNPEDFHTGNIAFSPDGKRAYFTRCTDEGERKIQCMIMLSSRNGNSWTDPVQVNSQAKDELFSNSHPSVMTYDSIDVVYFSSNRPGGFGGYDLWYTEVKKDGTASEPVNLGQAVNTIDDEVTPCFLKNKLYFSSNGHIGLGGLDVFVASGLRNGWSKPQNMGYPLNSSADDTYFAKGESAKIYYLVSNRPRIIGLKSATCCDDIFRVEDLGAVKYTFKGRVFEKIDTVIQLTGARLEIFEITSGSRSPANDKLLSGDYEFTFEMSADKDYEVKLTRKGYFPQTIRVLGKDNPEAENLTKDIVLERIEKKKAYRLDKVYYDFNKSSLTEESKETLQKLYELLVENPKLVVEISSHTDDVGKDQYNLKLSQDRAQSCVDYLIYLGIEAKRLIPKGYGETQPIASNKNKDGSDNEEGRQQNRRTEFKVVGELSRVGDKVILD